jgi:hypothetical protein
MTSRWLLHHERAFSEDGFGVQMLLLGHILDSMQLEKPPKLILQIS